MDPSRSRLEKPGAPTHETHPPSRPGSESGRDDSVPPAREARRGACAGGTGRRTPAPAAEGAAEADGVADRSPNSHTRGRNGLEEKTLLERSIFKGARPLGSCSFFPPPSTAEYQIGARRRGRGRP